MDIAVPKGRVLATASLGLLGSAVGYVLTRKLQPVIDHRVPDLDTQLALVLGLLVVIAVVTGGFLGALFRPRRTLIWQTALVAAVIPVGLALATVSHWPPVTREAQKRTMSRMLILSSLIEGYHRDHGGYPIAGPAFVEALSLFPQGGTHPHELRDGWGKPLYYRSDGFHYEVRSFGADGVQNDCPGGPGVNRTVDFACDIILENGQWIAAPSGIIT